MATADKAVLADLTYMTFLHADSAAYRTTLLHVTMTAHFHKSRIRNAKPASEQGIWA